LSKSQQSDRFVRQSFRQKPDYALLGQALNKLDICGKGFFAETMRKRSVLRSSSAAEGGRAYGQQSVKSEQRSLRDEQKSVGTAAAAVRHTWSNRSAQPTRIGREIGSLRSANEYPRFGAVLPTMN